MNRNAGRFSALLMAALLAIGAQQAMAQPVPGQPGMPGRAAHAHGFAMEGALIRLKGQLNLDTSQQLNWDNAMAQGKAAREAARTNMQNLRAAMAAELEQPDPDFAKMASLADAAQASNQESRRQVRALWLQIYATFSPPQKALVRDAMKAKMARAEAFRNKVRERMQQRGNGTG